MSAFVLAQPGLSASVTFTSVSVTSPLLVTRIVKLAVEPVTTAGVEATFVTEIAGLVLGATGGAGGVVTVTGAVSLAVTSGPAGGVPVAVARFVVSSVRAGDVQS